MNELPTTKRVQVLSMRSVSRVVDASINTAAKLLEYAGRACVEHHGKTMRSVKAKRSLPPTDLMPR